MNESVKEVIRLAQENAIFHRFIGDLMLYLASDCKISIQSYPIEGSHFIFQQIRELKELAEKGDENHLEKDKNA
ncbi:hypothetical protein [Bergeyella zoohelcum]|uniref:hypothetical protein n=1 Tax=Bergeyella zoohelcum TaxID=1015 RepID=UPI003734FBC5